MKAEELSKNAILTTIPVRRTCLICGEEACPCCRNWCDGCFEPDREYQTVVKEDERTWTVKEKGDDDSDAFVVGKQCADKMECSYGAETEEQAATRQEAWRQWDKAREAVGGAGAMGYLDDGRAWFEPEKESSS